MEKAYYKYKLFGVVGGREFIPPLGVCLSVIGKTMDWECEKEAFSVGSFWKILDFFSNLHKMVFAFMMPTTKKIATNLKYLRVNNKCQTNSLRLHYWLWYRIWENCCRFIWQGRIGRVCWSLSGRINCQVETRMPLRKSCAYPTECQVRSFSFGSGKNDQWTLEKRK